MYETSVLCVFAVFVVRERVYMRQDSEVWLRWSLFEYSVFQHYVSVLSGSYRTELPLWTSVYLDSLVLSGLGGEGEGL